MAKKIPTSGFERTDIGTIIKKYGKRFRLSNKWQITINKCPYCKSEKTFHKERMKTIAVPLVMSLVAGT